MSTLRARSARNPRSARSARSGPNAASLRRAVLLGLAAAVAVLAVFFRSSHVDGYTPTTSSLQIPTYSTPSLLSAIPLDSVVQGSAVWVTYQGPWMYSATCPDMCDGTDTCRVAGGASRDGGAGCWIRGAAGFPPAIDIDTWYVDSDAGNNAASCTGPGSSACLDLQEIVRRIGPQAVVASPTIYLAGNFGGASWDLAAPVGSVFQYMNVVGERIYTGADGGALWAGTVAAYQAWDGGAHLEGIATVVPVDGGVALPAHYLGLATGVGYFLEDETGLNAGIGFPMYMPDAGVPDAASDAANAVSFYTPGGQYPNSEVPSQFAVGDVVRLYTTTQVATTSGAQFNVREGVWSFQDVWLGNGYHTVQLQAPCGPGCGAVQFNSCTVNGLDVFTGSWLFSFGSQFVNGVRINGQASNLQSNQFDGVEVRANGFLELSGPNIIGYAGFEVGRTETGAGTAEVDTGPLAIIGYENPAITVRAPGGSVLINNVNVWGRNSAGESGAVPTFQVYTGSLGIVYTAGFVPAALGVQLASPWMVGGTGFASLPATNNGTFIQVWQ